jgi:hypothetical protein
MNRRRFLSLLAGAGATIALPFRSLLAHPVEPPALLSKVQWDALVFGREATRDHASLITSFVAARAHSGVYLFKNRAGQFIFQIYDPAFGYPTAKEAVYLMRGLPSGPGGWHLPQHMQPRKVQGIDIIGIEFDPGTTARQVNADLDRAFQMLMKAGAA